MTLNENDRKELVTVLVEAIENIVMPHIVELKDDMKGVKGELSQLREDHGERLERIEKKLDATIAVTDHHDRRLTRVEKHLGLPTLEPAA